MVVYPYVRQAVSDLSSRLGERITLQLLRPGPITLGDDGSEEPAEAEELSEAN